MIIKNEGITSYNPEGVTSLLSELSTGHHNKKTADHITVIGCQFGVIL
jgi:hypothetical protein